MEGESQSSGVDQHMKDTILERRFRKGDYMAKHEVQVSPRALARIAGMLYLIMIVVGIFDEAFVKGRIVVPSDKCLIPSNRILSTIMCLT